ncbi:MAG: hypothetical protein IIC89_04850 [Chloroflexi bacterium]|nr:hypothetical protein [Chloroflexota bacterium]
MNPESGGAKTAPWSARFYREGDEPGMLAVLQAAFKPWPKGELSIDPIEHLRWKLRSSELALKRHRVAVAHPNAARLSGASEDARIIGVSITIAYSVKVGDRLLLAHGGADAAVHPEFRNAGVMTEIDRLGHEKSDRVFDVHFGVQSGHEAIRRVGRHRQSGRRTVDVSVLVRPEAAVPDAAVADWAIRDVDRFDERVDTLWAEASRPYDIILARTAKRLNWRYCDPAAGGFSVKIAERDGRLLGYTAYRMSYGKGYIADLLALPGRLDVVDALVTTALRDFQNAGASASECWITDRHPYRDVLLRAGFTNARKTVGMVRGQRVPDADIAQFMNEHASVHVMLGDTDLI